MQHELFQKPIRKYQPDTILIQDFTQVTRMVLRPDKLYVRMHGLHSFTKKYGGFVIKIFD